jgi:hypothetical protein
VHEQLERRVDARLVRVRAKVRVGVRVRAKVVVGARAGVGIRVRVRVSAASTRASLSSPSLPRGAISSAISAGSMLTCPTWVGLGLSFGFG